MISYSLLVMIITGCFQLIVLLLLWPMSHMFKKALRMQKLTEYFKKERLPRNSIIIFVICYVMRSLLTVAHGVWALREYIRFSNGDETSSDVMRHYSTSDIFLAI